MGLKESPEYVTVIPNFLFRCAFHFFCMSRYPMVEQKERLCVRCLKSCLLHLHQTFVAWQQSSTKQVKSDSIKTQACTLQSASRGFEGRRVGGDGGGGWLSNLTERPYCSLLWTPGPRPATRSSRLWNAFQYVRGIWKGERPGSNWHSRVCTGQHTGKR